MDVLLHLAVHAGEVVTPEVLSEIAGRDSTSSPQVLANCIRELRELFGDREDSPRFIQTVPKRGYRLIAPITPSSDYVLQTDQGPIHVQPVENSPDGDFLLETSDGPLLLHPVAGSRENDVSGGGGDDGGWFADLKRRKVFRVLGAYAVGAWLILQIVDVLSGAFPVPDWTLAATSVALAIGFPIAAILSWILQITPSGVILDVENEQSVSVSRSRLVHFLDLIVISVLLIIVIFLSWGRFAPQFASDSEIRIAVLPFENLSEDETGLYVSEGIADDIRSRLYDVPQLLIAARTSSAALFKKGLDIKEMGERLTVDHILEGSVRRVDDRIRVTAQLVDVETGFNRWSKSYNTRIDNILDVQNNISLFVASELEILLSKKLRKALARNPTDDPVAYDYYLQARNYFDRPRSNENLDLAETLFRRAIERDQSFALGFAGLCRTFISRYSHSGDVAFIDTAEENCLTALDLDAGLSEVHTALGGLYLLVDKLDDAESSFTRAIEIDPRAAAAYSGRGDVFARQGKLEQAEAQYNAAIDILPANWGGYGMLGMFLLRQGRYEESGNNYERIIQLTPDNAHAYNNLGATYYYRGDFANAAENFRYSLDLEPGRAAFSNTGTMYYYAGNYAEAAAMFQNAVEEADDDYRLWGNLGDAQRFIDDPSVLAAGSYQTAISLANSEMDATGENAETLTNLAWYHVNLGDTNEAKRLLTLAEEFTGRDAQQYYVAALTYTLLNDADSTETSILMASEQGFPEVILDATPELMKSDSTARYSTIDQ
jgi:TolB-like protein/Flp pilus assembly protein TadD